MKNKVYKYHLTILVLLTFSFSNSQVIDFTKEEKEWIANHPVIEFGYEPNWEPYEIYKDGKYQGIVGEYVKIIEQKTGIKMKPIPNISWDESLKGLKDGSIKMVPCCAITPKRQEYLDFTEVYINDPLVVVTKKDDRSILEMNDLKNRKVGLPSNYYTAELLQRSYPEAEIIEHRSIQDCLEAISYGRVDAFIENLGVVNYYINHKGFTNIKIAAPTYFKNSGIALAVTKDWTIFRDIAQKVFNSITLKEETAIRQKWLGVELKYGVSWNIILKWSSIVIVLIIIIIGFFVYWNKTLRRNIKLRKKSHHELMKSLVAMKKQNNEKKILLQEIHHRVKNNLQIVSSMMRLQANISQNEAASKILLEAVDRIQTIALIHEKIYQSTDLGNIQLKEYIHSLVKDILLQFKDNSNLEVQINTNNISFQLDQIVPLALILNELITNSVKYAFPDGKENPIIEIELNETKSNTTLRYFDNGIWKENSKSDRFGTSLIEIFTEQLNGNYTLKKSSDGTEYLFNFS